MEQDIELLWDVIARNPSDPNPRLIFIDFLEENQTRLAEYKGVSIPDIIAGQKWQIENGKWPKTDRDSLLGPDMPFGWRNMPPIEHDLFIATKDGSLMMGFLKTPFKHRHMIYPTFIDAEIDLAYALAASMRACSSPESV